MAKKRMEPVYSGNQKGYAKTSGHGFRMLAKAMEKDLPYEIKCPALLNCGKKDRAGSWKRYSRIWHKDTQISLKRIEGEGQNSNTDKPEEINMLLEEFLSHIN